MKVEIMRRALALSIAAVAAFGVVACGGDDEEGDTGAQTGTTATETTAKEPTGTPVKLMTVTSVGSPLSNYPDIEAAAKAAADAINKEGGINGHPVESVFCNTKGDANGSTKCAREAISEKVAAFVGDLDIFRPVSYPTIEKAKIPIIGQHPAGAPQESVSEYSFPLEGGNGPAYSAFAYAAAKEGKTKFQIVTIDLPIAATQNEWVEAAAKDAGLEVLPQIKIPAQGTTDYTPFVQRAKKAGADAILIVQGPAGTQGVLKAAKAVGLEAMFGSSITSFGESEAEPVKDITDALFVGSPYPSIHDEANPGVKAWLDDLEAAGVGEDPVEKRTAGLNTWLAYHAVAELGKEIEGDITSESMLEALKATAGPIDVQGLVSWEPAKAGSHGKLKRFPPHPFYVLGFKDGKLVDPGIGEIEDPVKASR